MHSTVRIWTTAVQCAFARARRVSPKLPKNIRLPPTTRYKRFDGERAVKVIRHVSYLSNVIKLDKFDPDTCGYCFITNVTMINRTLFLLREVARVGFRKTVRNEICYCIFPSSRVIVVSLMQRCSAVVPFLWFSRLLSPVGRTSRAQKIKTFTANAV